MYKLILTAEQEEPNCSYCDRQDKCDGSFCGPDYGWALYYRVAEEKVED